MRRPVLVRFILLLICLGPMQLAWGEGLLIIVNPQVPIETLSLQELSNIYLLHTSSWSNGQQIVPVNRDASSQEREHFSEQVFHQSTLELSDYWNRLRFEGKFPPVVQISDQGVVGFVRSVPGAIGYIRDTTEHSGVKILARLK